MFKVGDTVRLKSGGPLMTVTGLGTDPQKGQMVWTSWFDASGKENHGHWPAAAVEADAGAA
jgi:uncharacterized protein YodC (DUF2158 family)